MGAAALAVISATHPHGTEPDRQGLSAAGAMKAS
jgi:hypothetical protein